MSKSASRQHFISNLADNLAQLRTEGLYKPERVLASRQGALVSCDDGRELINLCANNYLGLSGDEAMVQASIAATEQYGYGLSSVRFICGTQTVHKQLEQALASFLGTEDCILYAAAFDANGGLFEPLFDERDAIISDALNHASIIDGIRLCKAARYRYAHNDMADLEAQLQAAAGQRHRIIVTDGVFSMDGTIAQLDRICALAEQYDALVMIDECHASGFMGATGRGTHEHHGVLGRIDIITGTLGKALGGAMGGFTAGRKEVIDTLRQKSRPYLFSNTLAPSIAGASLAVLQRLASSTDLRDRLHANTAHFRREIAALGFTIKPGTHPVVPVMLFDAPVAQQFAARLYELGVLVTGFFYPVVPMGQARVRVQLSAAHSTEQLDTALAAFAKAGRELGLIT
ncbi:MULTISPECIES: glycine C-acetyltransferase [unclassified Undibacterium]|uniref:glycine C-acetyltransferase n=1 Tax=unclassified Undibacterium TaxID=2630295 RepID=UPI002AC9065C|nr:MULTISPECIES: glycine C-acetyltransferase [unclassified Undibacterium]MEB0138293.1 glycine C-acetyltransferase [Undibacterium sp. CCC2.1]MEB0170779.1 glycine C-acetyltransferase [Undibacterium sp. CCC1.1]MEB0174668.1 glycine C-acetyltransferase [Undibacterium sp. CCC3.4]MEB0213865.1 glycine C-acetyltransferase [Undibacterium sp. 5I2]WPX42591.1 glycine C-acetyltransferase [Undibacterium sp. CCC3.4]